MTLSVAPVSLPPASVSLDSIQAPGDGNARPGSKILTLSGATRHLTHRGTPGRELASEDHDSPFGHDAFLKETDALRAALRPHEVTP